jgi:KipI family sensor histidine kinase inhibitor
VCPCGASLADNPALRCADVISCIHRLAETGALLDISTLSHARAVAEKARGVDTDNQLIEVIPAARTVYLQAPATALRSILERLLAAPLTSPTTRNTRLVTIDVRYGGPDLPDVAEQVGLSVDTFVRRHQEVEYEVAFFGFAPGQAFFAEIPEELRVPRRSVPRTRVPSGALAIANEFTIIYPESSPGGWNLIGRRVGPPLWVPGAQPPNAVDVGDHVRFVDVT